MNNNTRSSIENIRVSAPVKLSLLWASLMSLYFYNDYLLLWIPGQIEGMSAGSFGPFGTVSDLKLLAAAAFMAIPGSMIFLSSTLPSSVSRWLNMIIGPIHGVANALTLLPVFAAPLFFKFIVSIEVLITLLIIWTAARWPKHDD
ncbi:MAG: DUF6326 family protein [Wenzhouxiangellaceae bacterium]